MTDPGTRRWFVPGWRRRRAGSEWVEFWEKHWAERWVGVISENGAVSYYPAASRVPDGAIATEESDP